MLDDLTGDKIRVLSAPLQGRIRHAWALTVHKFQGSETDTVVYGISNSLFETWQTVYTAVTRGKKRVIVVGKYSDLRAAVGRAPVRRQTTLNEKLRTMLEKSKNMTLNRATRTCSTTTTSLT